MRYIKKYESYNGSLMSDETMMDIKEILNELYMNDMNYSIIPGIMYTSKV